MNPLEFATSVVQNLQSNGHVAVFAGGCVRDMLLAESHPPDCESSDSAMLSDAPATEVSANLGTDSHLPPPTSPPSPPDDYDVATDATPQRVRELFGKKSTLAVGESFGVIIVLGPKVDGRHLQVEVATFRTEGEYTDGRRPDNVVFCTAEEDAARRDFTINGMFYDPLADQVLDYVGGHDDLERGVIRAIGNPHDRIAEDKLRMLRAVRFTARFGFELDPTTRDAVQQHAADIAVVSWERITQELTKILRHPSRHTGVTLMRDVGLLAHVIPELDASEAHFVELLIALHRLDSPTFPMALVTLLNSLPAGQFKRPKSGTISSIGQRLKLSNEAREDAVWLRSSIPTINRFVLLELYEKKQLLAHPLAEQLIGVATALSTNPDDEKSHSLAGATAFLKNTSREDLNPPVLITGDDLKRLGIPPGPKYKEILSNVRREQLNDRIQTPDEADSWVSKTFCGSSH